MKIKDGLSPLMSPSSATRVEIDVGNAVEVVARGQAVQMKVGYESASCLALAAARMGTNLRHLSFDQ
jgi:hypothetical protein